MARRGGPAGISPHWHSQQLLWEGAQPGDAFPCLGKDSLSTFCLSELVAFSSVTCYLLSHAAPWKGSRLRAQAWSFHSAEVALCRGSSPTQQGYEGPAPSSPPTQHPPQLRRARSHLLAAPPEPATAAGSSCSSSMHLLNCLHPGLSKSLLVKQLHPVSHRHWHTC